MMHQIRLMMLGLAICLVSSVNTYGAVVTFTGTWSTYLNLGGAPDPLNILGESFGIRADIDGAGNVTSGIIRITSGPGSHYSINLTGPNGGSATTPFTISAIPTAAGGFLSFGTTQNIPNFSFASLTSLGGSSGSASLTGLFGANLGSYTASITAVPEPSSIMVLGALVSGCGLWQYRRHRRKVVA